MPHPAKLSIVPFSKDNGGLSALRVTQSVMNEFFTRLPEFVGNHLGMSLLFIALVLVLVYTEIARLRRGFKELTPAMLTQLINRDNAMVFDLSPRAEFDKGHVPGARHVAMDQFDPESDKLKKIRDRPIVVVCKSGMTSAKAAARLRKAGFTRVHTLGGGVDAWRRADLPLARD